MDGELDGAAGFACVLASAEVALEGPFLDVREGTGEAVFGGPDVEFPDAWGVDDEAAAGEEEEFAPGGGVPAFGIGFADGEGVHDLIAHESVDEAGLADARSAEEDGCGCVWDEPSKFAHAFAGSGADDEDRLVAR